MKNYEKSYIQGLCGATSYSANTINWSGVHKDPDIYRIHNSFSFLFLKTLTFARKHTAGAVLSVYEKANLHVEPFCKLCCLQFVLFDC